MRVTSTRLDQSDTLPDVERTVEAEGIAMTFNPSLGILSNMVVRDGQRRISPLHRAPWVGTEERMPPDAAPHLRALGGDFFCAPFGEARDGAPLHGWPANSGWRDVAVTGSVLRAELEREVQGARLTKLLTLCDGHPFVYQEHVFDGGSGSIAVANHANVSLKSGAIIRTSDKDHWQTPQSAPEGDAARGRSFLRYPARAEDPTIFPSEKGTTDLGQYPWADRHEDFVMGVEASGHKIAWVAVTRPAEGDLFLSLCSAAQAPMTMLWQSNGGRDYAPWSGRHFGCLGVEMGAASKMLSHADAADLVGPGELRLGGIARIQHAIGAIDWPSGEPVIDVAVSRTGLSVIGNGVRRDVAFDLERLGVDAP